MGRNLGPLNIKDSYEGLVQISGSQLTDGSGSLISDLDITASDATTATTATTASYVAGANVDGTVASATSASHAVQADSATTATTATTASYVEGANVDGQVASALSSSYALTASFAENVPAFNTGSLLITASAVDATTTYTKGDGSTFTTTINNVTSSISASHAVQADNATTATSATTATTASYVAGANVDGTVASATSASYAVSSSQAENANTATSASFATTASFAENVSTPTLQEVTTEGATTTDNVEFSGSVKVDINSSVYFETEKNGNDQFRLVSNDSLNSITLNQSGSQTVKLDFNNSAGEIESSGDLTLDTTGNTVQVLDSMNVQTALTASGLNYPTADGTNGQVLTTDGAGNLTLEDAGGGAAFPFTGSAEIEGRINVQVAGDTDNTVGSQDGTIVAGSGINLGTGVKRGIFVGKNQTVSGGGEHTYFFGEGLSKNGFHSHSFIGGGFNHTLDGANLYGVVIMGGNNNTIDGGTSSNGIFVGSLNEIEDVTGPGSEGCAVIIGGRSNKIEGTFGQGAYSAIVGGTGNLAQHSGSVILGGTALTSSKANEVTVPHLSVNGDIDITSGSFSGSAVNNITDTYTGTNAVQHVISLTQAEYDAIGTKDNETLYYITDASSPSPFPFSGSAIITGSLEMVGDGLDSATTASNNQGTIVIGNEIDSSYELDISGVKNSIVGGVDATFASVSANPFIKDSKNVVVLGNGQIQTFQRAVEVQEATGSVVLASSNVRLGTFGGTGTSLNNAVIASSGTVQGRIPFGGAYSAENVVMTGNTNPRICMSAFGGRNHNLNAVYNSQVFGGTNNDFPNAFSGDNCNIAFGQNNTISGGSSAQIVGGNNNTKSGGAGPGIAMSANTSFTNGASFAVVIGSRQSTMAGGDTVGIIGGQSNRINYGFADFIFGGYNNLITGRNNDGRGSVLVGGNDNEINGNGIGAVAILGGNLNYISGSDIDNSAIIAGSGSLVQHNRSVIVGGNEYTTTADDQVIVPQLVSSGSVTNAGGLFAMEPWATLPAAASHTNTFAVSGSKPYFSDGTSWNALF